MLEPFIWMFKVADFKSHFIKLFGFLFLIWIPLAAAYFLFYNFIDLIPVEVQLIIKIVFVVFLFLPFLCLTGYFWMLADNIIYRETDVAASNVYNRRFSLINIIQLPKWSIGRFIWRGIASCVATIIMCIPFILILNSSFFNINQSLSYWGLDSSQIEFASNCLAIAASIFIPGLLWNYAKRDSIVATLNIFKVLYLFESYPLKYIAHCTFFLLISFINASIIVYIATNLNIDLNSNIVMSLLTNNNILQILLTLFIAYLLGLYLLYVYAYILGTLTPNNEN